MKNCDREPLERKVITVKECVVGTGSTNLDHNKSIRGFNEYVWCTTLLVRLFLT